MTPKRIIFDQPERIATWVEQRIGTPQNFERYTAIGLESGGELIAGAVFTGYTDVNLMVHVAGTRLWASPVFLRTLAHYAFRQCGVRRVTALTAAKNVRCRRLIERCGFELEGQMKHAMPDDDVVVYGVLAERAGYLLEGLQA
jgi:RimJ/RimL family protein N-acetyltransferase